MNVTIEEVQAICDRDSSTDHEWGGSAADILARLTQTLEELSDRQRIRDEIAAGGEQRLAAIADLVRFTAHDIHREAVEENG